MPLMAQPAPHQGPLGWPASLAWFGIRARAAFCSQVLAYQAARTMNLHIPTFRYSVLMYAHIRMGVLPIGFGFLGKELGEDVCAHPLCFHVVMLD